MARLRCSNSTSRLLCISLEPMGEDYWIQPDEAFDFRGSDPGAYFAVVHDDDGTVAVYIEGNSWDVTVSHGDVVLSCGHQRPPGLIATSLELSHWPWTPGLHARRWETAPENDGTAQDGCS